MLKYFATKVDDGWGGFEYDIKPLGYAAMIAVLVLLLVAIALFNRKKHNNDVFQKRMNTKQLAFAAVSLALAVVASYLKVYKMPTGGSITLCSMLFVTLVGYWYGPKVGITTAIAYGILQLILDPYVVSLPQMILDYPLAFGALGLSGFFCNKKHGLAFGYLLGVLGRFCFATLSGVIFFASYAPEGQNVWIYSMSYNGFYLAVEGIITFVVLAIPYVEDAFSQVKRVAVE